MENIPGSIIFMLIIGTPIVATLWLLDRRIGYTGSGKKSKTNKAKASHANQKSTFSWEPRGKFLTVVLLILTCLSLVSLPDLIDPSSNLTLLGRLHYLLSFIGLIGMWLWRKWAVYLQFMLYLLSFTILIPGAAQLYPTASSPSYYDLGNTEKIFMATFMLLTLIPFLIVVWAIRRKWQYFK